jgi:plasmid stabilization system protein ParE
VTRIVWTLQAVEDVEAIRDYVARDSVHSAQLLASRLILSVERLAQFPDSGRIVPEVGDETIREVVLGNYRIVYRLAASQLNILTVFHGARLFPDMTKGS